LGAFFLAAFFLAIVVLSYAAVTTEADAARRPPPRADGASLLPQENLTKCGEPIMPTALPRNKQISCKNEFGTQPDAHAAIFLLTRESLAHAFGLSGYLTRV
jgi:hypothetical protein